MSFAIPLQTIRTLPVARLLVGVGVFVVVTCTCASSAFASIYSAAVLADNPVSYWQLNETSGTTALDSADGNNGANTSITTGVAGLVGDAYGFNGSSSRVGMGNPANLNFGTTGAFSLEAVFKWDGGGDMVHNIIRKSNFPSPPGSGYWLRILRDSETLEFFTGETTGVAGIRGSVATTISPDVWYHAVGTRDSAGLMSLYVNGVLVDTTSVPGADTTSSAPFVLGAWDDIFGIIEHYDGTIDDVAVYDYALSSGAVAAHANASVIPEPSSLLVFGGLALCFGLAARRRRRRHAA
ncbi:MAG: LamG domain-containing protein [Planctomycetes bacterium]|nr:LamG domain-containing protein [Planctomycetota bacterium]